MMSSEFEWNTTPELYRFFVGTWDVAKAKQIILKKPRDVTRIRLTSLKSYVERPQRNDLINAGHNIDWNKIDTPGMIDLAIPLIGVLVKNAGPWIIDGWHRMAKGFEAGQEIFSVVLLTQKESNSVFIRR